MMDENIIKDVLTYLKKAGPTNTFRLATETGLERAKLLNLLKKLEEKQAVKFECGNAIFIKYISEEKLNPTKIKEPSKPKKKIKNKQQIKKVKSVVKRKPATPKALQLLQTENIQLKEKLTKLEETIKELEKKAIARPKTIIRTRTITKTVVKKVPVTKTVIKKIFIPLCLPPKKVEKSEETKEKVWEKLKTYSKKFKIPNFKLLEKIKQLKRPEFAKK